MSSKVVYNAIKRMFCRLEGYRRIATRNDNHVTNFTSTVCLTAAISC